MFKRFFAVIASRTVRDKNGRAMGINLTEAASQKLKEIEQQQNKYVRLEIDAGGCHGFQYNFQLLPKPAQGDAPKLADDDM